MEILSLILPNLTDPQVWISLLTLTFLEIVLGVDNIIFISILSDKLPKDQQNRARNIGLGFAMIFRVGLLLTINWLIGLNEPVFSLELFSSSLAVIISMSIMMLFSGIVSKIINTHPSLQMLALSFLVVIGVLLVAEGIHQHISKNIIYSCLAFSLTVELLNINLRKKQGKSIQ